jgi:hypothetical protein
MKKLSTLFAILLALVISSNADQGKIQSISITGDDSFWFQLNGTSGPVYYVSSASLGCAVGGNKFKNTYALILLAYSRGDAIWTNGTNVYQVTLRPDLN